MLVSRDVRGESTEGRAAREWMGWFVPSHLANSSGAMGSSFGGSSWTGTLGANRSDIVVVVVVVGRW